MTSDNIPRRVAYFTMEVALDNAIPTYSGGLGVLAGDTLRSAADLHAPIVAISLLYRSGYFRQSLDGEGHQSESAISWDPLEHLKPLDTTINLQLEGRTIVAKAWQS